MMLELPPSRQRVAAVTILALLMLVMLFFLVLPLWASSSMHGERIDKLKRQAMAMTALADAAPRFETEARKLAANPEIQGLTYSAPQSALGIAQLQGHLSQMFVNTSSSVTSSQVLPEALEGALVKIGVQMMVEADVKGLVNALYVIDKARPLLTVEKLVIRDPDGDWAVTTPLAQPNRLQVEIVVSAYMRAP
jgi:hypothetical protein